MPSPIRLILLDASIYIFQGWHVLPDSFRDAADKPVNAVLGFGDTLARILLVQAPVYLACGFDTSLGKGVRQEIHSDYKANRPEAPADLKYQFAVCRELADAFGVQGFASDRYEADDILGTFARHAQQREEPFIVVTADKDLTQLLGRADWWWNCSRDDWLDYRGVERRFGARPGQIPDLLALAGDAVDNIPGVPGIGQTTAARLLRKWGNIDTLYDNLERVGDMKFRGARRVQDLLEEHRDTVEISRQLTPVLIDHSLSPDIDRLRVRAPDPERLAALFERLQLDPARESRWRRALKCDPVDQA